MNFSNLFNMDNAFFRMINKTVDLIWLNILTLICCIPVITGGAAFTAMYYVLLRIADNEDGYVTSSFFRAFKQNFKNATKVWLIVLALVLFYVTDIRLLRAGVMVNNPTMEKVVRVTIYIMLVILAMGLCYFFPLLARYDNKLKITVKNSFLFACAYLPRTLCMIVIYLFPVALMLVSNWFILFWLVLGFTFPGCCCASILVKLLKRTDEIQNKNTNDKDTEGITDSEEITDLKESTDSEDNADTETISNNTVDKEIEIKKEVSKEDN